MVFISTVNRVGNSFYSIRFGSFTSDKVRALSIGNNFCNAVLWFCGKGELKGIESICAQRKNVKEFWAIARSWWLCTGFSQRRKKSRVAHGGQARPLPVLIYYARCLLCSFRCRPTGFRCMISSIRKFGGQARPLPEFSSASLRVLVTFSFRRVL